MGIELSALEIPIVVPGLDQAHRGLQTLDTDGQRAARGLEMAADSVAGFTAEARLGTDRMVHAIEVLGAQLTTTKRTTKDTGDEFGRTGDRARGLTVALRDIGRGGTAGLDAMARRVREFTDGLQHASTRAASIAGLERQEAALTRALAAGNLTTGQRIRLEGERKRVQGALQLPRLEAAEAALRRQLEAGNTTLRQRIRLRRELRAAESATQAARGGAVAAGAAAGGMSGVLGAVGVAVGAGTGITAANRAADAYDRAEAAQRKLSATSRLTGASLAFVSGTAKDLERDLQLPAPVAGDLTAVMVRLASRAGDVTQSGTAIRRVLDLAAASGYGASEAIEAITAAMTGSDEQLNRLGLANPQQIYEEWARAAGTTAAKMTDAQKAQAILSALVAQGAKVEGEYARRLDTSAGLTEKRQQATEKAFASIGQALAPLRDLMNRALTAVADFAKAWPKVTSAIVGVGGALLAIETVTRAVKALTVAQTANAAVSTSKFLPALRAIGAFLASPAGALVLALAGAGGVVAFAQSQENKRERAPREAAEKAAAALTPEQASASVTPAIAERDRLLAKIREQGTVTAAMSGAEREAANRRNTELSEELRKVDALIVAYRAKAKEMFADVEGGGAPKRQPKSKEELEKETKAREQALEAEIKALAELADANRLRGSDLLRIGALEAQTRAEMDRGNVSVARRAELLERLTKLEAARKSVGLGELPKARVTASGEAPEDQAVGIFADLASGNDLNPSEIANRELTEQLAAHPVAPITVTVPITPKMEIIGKMADSLDAQFGELGMNIGSVFASAIHAGISAFGDQPITFKTFLETAGNTLLQGLGGIMSDMGAQLLLMGGVMTTLLPFFSNPITAGPAMLIAGGILLTAGAALGAIATRNSGRGGGGGGGSVSAPASFDQSASVILQPRAAARGTDPRGALAPSAPTQPGLAPSAQLRPVTNVWHLMNPADPATQRIVREANRGGERRGIR